MSDNTVLNPGVGGDTIALDDIGGVKYQRIKLIYGADGVNSGDVATGNGLPVNATGTVAISSGTVTLSGNPAVVGNVAAGVADSGAPVKMGHVASTLGADPTAYTTGQRTNQPSNYHGIPYVQVGHPNIQTLRATFSAAQTNTILVTPTGRLVVTRVTAALSNGVTVDVSVLIGFGATTPTTTGVVFSHPGMAASQSYSEGDGSGILGIGAVNVPLRITCDAATTGALDIVISYYVLPG